MHGGARSAPDLHAEDLGPRQRQPDAAQAEERVGLPSTVKPGTGLSPPASTVRMVTGLARRPFQHLAVGAVLRLLVRQAGRLAEQEFGAHQADAVAGRDVDARRRRSGSATLTSTRDGRAVGGRGRLRGNSPASRRRVAKVAADLPEQRLRLVAAGRQMPPCSASSKRAQVGHRRASAPRPTTIGTPRARASMATWLAGLPAVSAMPPPGAPVRLERSGSARCRRRQGWRPDGAGLVAVIGQRARGRGRGCPRRSAGAGAEIVVVGRLVAGDRRRRARRRQASSASGAVGDRREGRRGQRVVRRAWRAGIRGCPPPRRRSRVDQGGELRRRCCDGDRRERARLGLRRSPCAASAFDAAVEAERSGPFGVARRRGHARSSLSGPGMGFGLVEIALDQRDQRVRRRLAGIRRRWRADAAPCPSAPWPP